MGINVSTFNKAIAVIRRRTVTADGKAKPTVAFTPSAFQSNPQIGVKNKKISSPANMDMGSAHSIDQRQPTTDEPIESCNPEANGDDSEESTPKKRGETHSERLARKQRTKEEINKLSDPFKYPDPVTLMFNRLAEKRDKEIALEEANKITQQ